MSDSKTNIKNDMNQASDIIRRISANFFLMY